jgi:DNA-binding MarR family transcriptional regulator
MTRLGSLLQVHPTSVTSAVSRLVAQGYVERSRGETDRRVVRAVVTASGREVVERATQALNTRVFADPGLPPDEVRGLTATLTALREGLGEAL